MSDRSEEIQAMMNEILDKDKIAHRNGGSTTDSGRINQLLDQVNAMSANLNAYIDANTRSSMNQKIDQLTQDAKKDFGSTTSKEEMVQPATAPDLKFDIYSTIQQEVTSKVFGQDEAIYSMMVAFRRSLLVDQYTRVHEGSMVLMGPKGSGRHYALDVVLTQLSRHRLLSSKAYTTLDCSRYTSNSQEPLFFQDIFTAINKEGNVIVIENFEKANPLYLRYLSEFLTTGKILLNKRYIQNSKGQLIETNGGFVQQSVDSLEAKDHYLVLMTSMNQGKLMGYFGADFFKMVPDVIEFKANSDETIDKVMHIQLDLFKTDCQLHYHIALSWDEAFVAWLKDQYIPANGIDSLQSALDNLKEFVVQLFLENKIHAETSVYLTVVDRQVHAQNGNNDYTYGQISNTVAINEIEAELDEIVGLDEVKAYIRALKDNLSAQQLRAKQGFKASEVNMHMVFTGNPGTGKTTIARLISRYMKAIGVLSKGQLIEVTRGDLVGQYVGHTAPQTMSVVKSALGGVLFIDEAYALFRGKDDSFGLEAIDTLVKAMEDYRDDLIVILAGYTEEMKTFLDANSGLKSRFPQIIEFPDYTSDQLLAIAKSIAKGQDYKIDSNADEALMQFFELAQARDSKGSGNGRLARNVVEDAILHASQRVLKQPGAAMDILIKEDFDLSHD